MDKAKLHERILAHLPDAKVTIDGEGCNLSCVVKSAEFEGVTLLDRQKQILALVSEEIKSGELHALSIKARTPAES